MNGRGPNFGAILHCFYQALNRDLDWEWSWLGHRAVCLWMLALWAGGFIHQSLSLAPVLRFLQIMLWKNMPKAETSQQATPDSWELISLTLNESNQNIGEGLCCDRFGFFMLHRHLIWASVQILVLLFQSIGPGLLFLTHVGDPNGISDFGVTKSHLLGPFR